MEDTTEAIARATVINDDDGNDENDDDRRIMTKWRLAGLRCELKKLE